MDRGAALDGLLGLHRHIDRIEGLARVPLAASARNECRQAASAAEGTLAPDGLEPLSDPKPELAT